jgi:epoxyqueuosine reductase
MSSQDSPENQVIQFAKDKGFEFAGIAQAEPLEKELEHFKTWLDDGFHGDMQWMERDPERRCDPERVLPGCQSVIVVGKKYEPQGDPFPEPEKGTEEPTGKVSRYARGKDYHRVMDKPLKKIAKFLNSLGDDETRSKPYVDHGPVLERQWALRAGLGFIGKHTLLINPMEGSWFFLGVVLTTLKLSPSPIPHVPGSCGNCRRCIDACPTDAITEAPHRVDARRCISYLTIEHKGEIDDDVAKNFSDWVFGCDICQEVCPYNLKRATPPDKDDFAPSLLPGNWSLAEMLELTDEELKDTYRQSPIRRSGTESLKRNAEIVLKNKENESE